MPKYTDGFVIPVAKKKLKAYLALARKGAKIWREYGVLDYKECVDDELASKFALPFPRGIRSKPGEAIVFSWIVYKSKAHRDRVNARIMKDPRFTAMCDPQDMPFECKRMLYGGFKVVVST
jgi:uncharacterized protein YbaA (DUF1428 family)